MTLQPKTAFVLAAGLGLRMRPLTENLPKPLVRLNGRPLIDHVLDRLEEAGIGRVVINVHHLADQLVGHLEERRRPHLVLSDERAKLLDTGGGVSKALKTLGTEPFLIHNSDSVWIEGIGSNLARMELTVAVEELLKRVPDFSLNGNVTWSEGTVRGPRKLPLEIA